MTELNIFEEAILSHGQWKYHLRQAIETGTSEWTIGEVQENDRCDLGGWLENLSPSTRLSEPYCHLRSLHTEFHKVASEVLTLALSGKKDDARAALSIGSRFERLSSELILTLSKWVTSDSEQA